MSRTPETVSIKLHDLMLLLNYRWSAVNSPIIGELGETVHEELVSQIDAQSSIEITPMQLADLIHHMKESTFEKIEPVRLKFGIDNYNTIMRRLKRSAPHLFKELPHGEVVMHELEAKVNE